jgi:hypothetical protein
MPAAKKTDSKEATAENPPQEKSAWVKLSQQFHQYGWCVQLHPPGASHLLDAPNHGRGPRPKPPSYVIPSPLQTSSSGWSATVQLGLRDKRFFTTNCHDPNVAVGRTAVSEVIMAELASDIEFIESLPMVEFHDAFMQPLEVHSGTFNNWDYFWNHPPECVGIDVEGHPVNFKYQVPVLVQIATMDYVIVDIPRNGRLSDNLLRLLRDDSIVKVVCDSPNHADKRSLGILAPDHPIRSIEPTEFATGTLIDLEAYASIHLGPLIGRGLARILTLSMPELQARFFKPPGKESCARFYNIQQGKAPPIQRLGDLTVEEQQYAARDAWCALYAYLRLREQVQQKQTL